MSITHAKKEEIVKTFIDLSQRPTYENSENKNGWFIGCGLVVVAQALTDLASSVSRIANLQGVKSEKDQDC